MSDEQHRGDETAVEGHYRRVGVNDEPAHDDEETEESEVEAHIRYPSVRMD